MYTSHHVIYVMLHVIFHIIDVIYRYRWICKKIMLLLTNNLWHDLVHVKDAATYVIENW